MAEKEIEVSAPATIEVVEKEGGKVTEKVIEKIHDTEIPTRTIRSGDGRQPINWQIIFLALIAIMPPTVIAAAAWNQSRETHTLFNSRMTEMMELVKQNATAQATLVEKNAQRRREGSAAENELERQEGERKEKEVKGETVVPK